MLHFVYIMEKLLEADWLIRQWAGMYQSLLGGATWIMEDEFHVV
jgi:hypothetical protein